MIILTDSILLTANFLYNRPRFLRHTHKSFSLQRFHFASETKMDWQQEGMKDPPVVQSLLQQETSFVPSLAKSSQ